MSAVRPSIKAAGRVMTAPASISRDAMSSSPISAA
jgi:hypothetical protein